MSLVIYAWAEDTCEVEEFEVEVVADPTDWSATMKEAFQSLAEDLELDEDLEITNSRTTPVGDGVISSRIETGFPDGGGAAQTWHLYACTADSDLAGELADSDCAAFEEGKDAGDDDGPEPADTFEDDDEDLEADEDEAVGDDD